MGTVFDKFKELKWKDVKEKEKRGIEVSLHVNEPAALGKLSG